MQAKPIPQGYEGATPYLICKDAKVEIEFCQKAFGATLLFQLDMPDGKVGHAELKVAGGLVMLADEFPEWKCLSPATIGGSGSSTMIYVEDVDALFQQAVAAGAKVLQPLENHFYGDRTCKLEDPSGHAWMFSTHIEDVPPDQMQLRLSAMCQEGAFTPPDKA
jgi:PhnB protein